MEYYTVNGKTEGILKYWGEKNQLLYEKEYKNGKLNGTIVSYFDNGKINSIIKYKDNRMVKKTLICNKDGRVLIYNP